MTENTHARITRGEAATLAGRSVRQISRWARAEKVSVVYENRNGKLYATFDRTEVLAAAGEPCLCGEPDDLLTMHRAGRPCYLREERTNRAADSS